MYSVCKSKNSELHSPDALIIEASIKKIMVQILTSVTLTSSIELQVTNSDGDSRVVSIPFSEQTVPANKMSYLQNLLGENT